MIALFNETTEYADNFTEKTYSDTLDMFIKKYTELFTLLRETFERSEEELIEAASYVPVYVAEYIGQNPQKKRKNVVCLDQGLNVVSYYLPLISEIESERTADFIREFVRQWNDRIPSCPIEPVTRAQIESGFRKRLCYITTAVCKGLSKPDDCYELMMLRRYRDGYLLQTEEGQNLVNEYYNIAPTIVKRIEQKTDAYDIYDYIWKNYLEGCIHMIEADQLEECRDKYTDMVHMLENKFLYA